jgi:adenosylcobyric acid synthase
MRTLMVWGCTSGAGKSLVATALVRLAARRGIAVAPSEAQRASNHARIVRRAAPTEAACGPALLDALFSGVRR